MPSSGRVVEIVVVSDLHLGTFGCHAQEILDYLHSIQPKMLILNGDIIDGWAFSKKYFPKEHMAVVARILKMAQSIPVIYLTGNHDDFLRRYSGQTLGNLQLEDKFILERDGKKMWFFHGDIFDHTTQGNAKFLAKLGGKGYDLLIWLNFWLNRGLQLLGRPKVSLSKKVKNSVKRAVKFIGDFEQIAIELSLQHGYDYVACGHIHVPTIRKMDKDGKSTTYLNSGDWIENLTALEYNGGEWSLYHHSSHLTPSVPLPEEPLSPQQDLEAFLTRMTAPTAY